MRACMHDMSKLMKTRITNEYEMTGTHGFDGSMVTCSGPMALSFFEQIDVMSMNGWMG